MPCSSVNCSNNKGCNQCSEGYHLGTNGAYQICQPCPDTCRTCSSTTVCNSCKYNYYFSNNKGLTCEDLYLGVRNMILMASVKYVLMKSDKYVCYKKETNCAIYQDLLGCIKSLKGYYLIYKCSYNCLQCLSRYSFTGCNENCLLNLCEENQFVNNNNSCENCPANCINCDIEKGMRR